MRFYREDNRTVIDGRDCLLLTKKDAMIEVGAEVRNLIFRDWYLVGSISTFKSKWSNTKAALKFIWCK